MKQNLPKLSNIAVAVALSSGFAGYANAQSSVEPSSDDGSVVFEELIVTGTAGGQSVSQLDAAFSVTAHTAEEIKKFGPKSTADLLKVIPGVWAESSGGIAGANVFVRGLPIAGDADFLTVQLQGMPVYGTSTLSFFEQTSIFRVDETIERMEGLRGGANTIFSNGQPGLSTNFILKEGAEESEGLLKLTAGDYGLARLDFLHSGPLSNGWNYMIGGYLSQSDGIRDAGFTSDKGKQLTVNLTKEWDSGKVSVYSRATDDFGTWYLPFAKELPGIDAGTFTQISPENRFQVFEVHPSRAGEVIDLGEGRGFKGNVFGINFEQSIGDLLLTNRLNLTSGDANTHGLVPDGGAILASDLGIAGTRAFDGAPVQGSTFVQGYGYWIVEKELDAFSNDLSVTGQLGAHELTAGFYYSDYSSYDEWSIGNQRAYEVGGSRIEGITCGDLADAGTGAACWGTAGPFAPAYDGNAKHKAFYLHDKWTINDSLTIDAGFRSEDYEADFDIAFASADGLGAFTNTKVDESETTYTVGVNYRLNDNSSVFLRANEGVTFPHFDNIRSNQLDIREVTQYEIGYKFQNENWDLYLTYFDSELDGNTFQSSPNAPVSVTKDAANGLEVDASYARGPFNVVMNATIQSTEQLVSSTPSNVGNSAARIPDYQVRITPSYSFNINPNLEAVFYGSLTAVDDRFGDQANDQLLPSFEKIDLGVLLYQGENLTYQISIDNVTDDDGLTEGDPRVVSGVASNARPILGRSAKVSVEYRF